MFRCQEPTAPLGRSVSHIFTINRSQASLNSKHTSQDKMGGSCMDGRVLCETEETLNDR